MAPVKRPRLVSRTGRSNVDLAFFYPLFWSGPGPGLGRAWAGPGLVEFERRQAKHKADQLEMGNYKEQRALQ